MSTSVLMYFLRELYTSLDWVDWVEFRREVENSLGMWRDGCSFLQDLRQASGRMSVMSSFVGSIEVCPILTRVTFFPFHAHTICLQDNGLFQRKTLGLKTWNFRWEKMKICGISRNRLENGWNSHK